MNTKFTIDSAAVRGDYMREIMDRTITDIHDSICTVFGPNAADAYIHKDGQLYYTRDGQEVLGTMKYDNVISNDILRMFYQAVERQATLVGDGTTTLTILYTNLYKAFREAIEKEPEKFKSLNVCRARYNDVITSMIEELKSCSVVMSDEYLHDMLYTCTQDAELSDLIYDKLRDALKDQAYMVVSKSNMDTEMEISVNDEPLINVEKVYSTYSIPMDGTKINDAVILYVDGMLDISDVNTLIGLGTLSTDKDPTEVNFVILCSSTSETTHKTINKYQEMVKSSKSKMNNIIIARILNTREYTEDMKEDLIGYLYNTIGVGGAVGAITFESMIHQAFMFRDQDGNAIERFAAYDFDPVCLDTIRDAYFFRSGVSFVPGKGMRIFKDMPAVAKDRYDKLVKEIETEKSGVVRNKLQKRLRTIYGKFIEIKVGSTLLKDSQRKYELILDAVKSAMDAYKNGALMGNSILRAAGIAYYLNSTADTAHYDYTKILCTALVSTFQDLSGFSTNTIYAAMDTMTTGGYEAFNDIVRQFNLRREGDELEPISDTITGDIIEPLSIITTLLKNSTMALELADAKMFCVDTSMRNYID